ncbi:carbamate kinase [Listeria sp. PSOL-1]|uniref:carbamate kinase n=1 Tax=Listeria sp. PSOL-1 TaxID=1844999 RepID=UPI0018D69EDD|nr:carbamate kinase [Listeria sp. PSOL-1]
MKRIVVALGGNALGTNLAEQMYAIKETAKAIADLIEAGYEVIVSHGNGPQVGMIKQAMDELTRTNPDKYPNIPLSVCVAMSQSYIGYDLQNALHEELLNRGIARSVSTVITQVEVDPKDEAFKHPVKPIGRFMTKEEAKSIAALRGIQIVEDSGRGYRQVVASPKPKAILEVDAIKALLTAKQTVIACGGGGIPVIAEKNHRRGVSAVIDKDFCSALLAEELDADALIILTAVEKVYLNFGKENQTALDEVSVNELKKLVTKGHFASGSMLPKVEAALQFADSKDGRIALITLLEKAKDGLAFKTGTRIQKECK